jgi:hypothetical protein
LTPSTHTWTADLIVSTLAPCLADLRASSSVFLEPIASAACCETSVSSTVPVTFRVMRSSSFTCSRHTTGTNAVEFDANEQSVQVPGKRPGARRSRHGDPSDVDAAADRNGRAENQRGREPADAVQAGTNIWERQECRTPGRVRQRQPADFCGVNRRNVNRRVEQLTALREGCANVTSAGKVPCVLSIRPERRRSLRLAPGRFRTCADLSAAPGVSRDPVRRRRWAEAPCCEANLFASSCQLPVSGCQLPVASFQLPVASFRLPVASCGQLPVASFQLPVASCGQLPVSSFRLPVAGSSHRQRAAAADQVTGSSTTAVTGATHAIRECRRLLPGVRLRRPQVARRTAAPRTSHVAREHVAREHVALST